MFLTQIQYGRGHIYNTDWLNKFQIQISTTTTVDGKPYYFLTWDDWSAFTLETRKEWLLQWLREWRKDEEHTELFQFIHDHEGVPYDLIQEYTGTFADMSTANCFAAAIAMVIGTRNQSQSRVLISQWLHQVSFFRLLHGQGYSKHTEFRDIADLAFQPSDVLVWNTRDGIASHAGYAVSDGLMFQKQGQGWDNPWQVLKISNV